AEAAQRPGFLSPPMRREQERCRLCLEEADKGHTVALVCSGDAGIYGMASPLYEMASAYEGCRIKVIPGITAASAGAAILGAPLGHDFCVISLSDLLVSREQIERRLLAAAEGDFVIVLYNPASKKRQDYPSWVCELLIPRLGEERPCGLVRNIGREGASHQVCRLGELASFSIDMITTVFIGNSKTRVIDGRLVTPRGYLYEQEG
ncbi:MAG: precorrin-3B C(17)-methyltransferase, partial [Lachnospiraceae bacterium]|nr:precorrin-3B C(17)-methyltransferase [Lachnospiraceae bacterium]